MWVDINLRHFIELRLTDSNWHFVHPWLNFDGAGESASLFDVEVAQVSKSEGLLVVDWDSALNSFVQDLTSLNN